MGSGPGPNPMLRRNLRLASKVAWFLKLLYIGWFFFIGRGPDFFNVRFCSSFRDGRSEIPVPSSGLRRLGFELLGHLREELRGLHHSGRNGICSVPAVQVRPWKYWASRERWRFVVQSVMALFLTSRLDSDLVHLAPDEHYHHPSDLGRLEQF